MKTQMTKLIHMTSAAALLCLALPALADTAPAPGQSLAFGNTLAGWQDTYSHWYVGQLNIPPDANGNADVGNIVLMPLPNTPGDGTPGSLNVTLHSGQGFDLPLLFLLGTSYTDGTPNDPLVDVSFFQTLNLTLQIDGVTVVNNANMMDYYSSFYFAPPIPFDYPPIASVIWFEGIAVVHGPLAVGTHVVKLDVTSAQALPPNFGGGILAYHNTWNLTVTP